VGLVQHVLAAGHAHVVKVNAVEALASKVVLLLLEGVKLLVFPVPLADLVLVHTGSVGQAADEAFVGHGVGATLEFDVLATGDEGLPLV